MSHENLINQFKVEAIIELDEVAWDHFELFYFTRLVHLLSHIRHAHTQQICTPCTSMPFIAVFFRFTLLFIAFA